MSLNLNGTGDKTNYAIGAGAGLGAGLAAGVATMGKTVPKALTENLATAVADYGTAQESFLERTVSADVFERFGESLQNAKQGDKKLVKLAKQADKLVEKTNAENAEAMEKKAGKVLGKVCDRIGKISNKLLKDPKNKESFGDAINGATDTFNKGEGKELFDSMNQAAKKVKNSNIKWIAGIAAAGLAIGAGVAYAVNKNKASKEAELKDTLATQIPLEYQEAQSV